MGWSNRVRTTAKAVLLGCLLGVGFIAPALWWLAVVGVVYALYQLAHNQTSVMFWIAAWTTKYLLALWWFWSVYPAEWLGVDGSFLLGAIGVYWVTAALWLGAGGAVFVWLYRTVRAAAGPRVAWGLLPLLWLVAELLGAKIFSLLTYGPGASIGAQFSFGMIGYHAAQHDWLLPLAHSGGVYGLTMVLVLLGMLLWSGWRLGFRGLAVASVVVLSSTAASTATEAPAEIDVLVAVVDTTVDPQYAQTADGIERKQQQITQAYAAAQATEAQYIILPEDARLLDQSRGLEALQPFLAFTHASDSPVVIDSGRIETSGGAQLQGVLYDPRSREVTVAHKQYLVPQGEFMPTLYAGAMRLIGLGEVADTLAQRFVYQPGPQQSQAHFARDLPALLFCFESVDPLGVRNSLQGRTDVPFVAHVVSHGWFTDPHTLWPQLEAMLRVQAVWNDVTIVSAANQAVGYVVTPTGAVLLPTPVAAGEGWRVGVVGISIE